MPAYSSHHDMTTQCGLSCWVWGGYPEEKEMNLPENVYVADFEKDKHILFTYDRLDDVDCSVCKPFAQKKSVARKEATRLMEEAGGPEEYKRKSIERIIKLRAEREAKDDKK